MHIMRSTFTCMAYNPTIVTTIVVVPIADPKGGGGGGGTPPIEGRAVFYRSLRPQIL
jgi:hypothetical protein